jgi:hypothetical protein
MSRRREVDRAAKRYSLARLGQFPVARLLAGAGLLMIWTFVFGAMVDEATATRHAARGEGVPGTFTAGSEACGRGGCRWYGTYTTGDFFQFTREGVELRGDDDRSLHAGESVTALDVGSGDFVHLEGGAPEWGPALATVFLAAFAGGIAALLNGMVLWDVYWTRASPSSRRRQARERGRFALRDLADHDRWGWSAKPGSSTIKAKIVRSTDRTMAAVAVLFSLIASLVLFALGWAAFNKETTWAEVVAGAWAPVLAIVLLSVTFQMLRLVLGRPRLWVSGDELVIWDGLLLWKALRIPRSEIAAVHYGDESQRRQVEENVARLTPFREDLNLALRIRDGISLPARRLRWGNWFWVMLALRGLDPRAAMPQRGRLFRWLCIRVKDPRRVAAELDRWLAEGEAPPPQTPVEPAPDGTVRTHRGTGRMRIKIKGQLPRPVLAEFTNDGPGRLRAWLRRTEFGQGTPVIACGPETSPATIVLDDRLVSDKPLTKRYLSVESEGRWTVTISGPERARAFTGSATGSGPEVLSYQGPAGIAVVTCPAGEPHQVYLHAPDLAALPGCEPVASAAASNSSQEDEPLPSRSTFAVPAQAVIQVRTAGAEWRIDVTPLEQADMGAPAARVRPFEHSLAGDRTTVVRYLGPPGPVLFRSGDAFGLLQLDDTLTPVRTLAHPDGDTEIRLRSYTLLQVTGGNGTWSLEEMHDLPPSASAR